MNPTVNNLLVEGEVKTPSSPALVKTAARAETDANAPVNLLLVDDDLRNLNVLESILASPDRQLVLAQSAEAALLALIQRDFAAIVLDVRMPDMSGFELAKLIKQRKRDQHIPIIFLTAYFQEGQDVLSGYEAGAVDYLTKPVDPQILKSKVNVFVDLFRSNRALAATIFSLENEIAERQQAELARDRLAAIVECSSDAILSKTPEGIITSWNKGAEKMFGYAAAEIVGRSVSMLLPVNYDDGLGSVFERIQRDETIESFETVRVRKGGNMVHVSLTFSPIKDAAGQITGVSAIMQDISERKRLEAEILHISEYEQRRIAEDLHDGVGQQLGGISFLSEALKKNLADQASPEAGTAARISNLLTVAVAETRSLARGLHPVATEANGLMSALEDLATRVTSLFKVSCRFECPQPVLVVDNTKATHLYRIAQEAITNAIKHGRAQQIEVRLSPAPEQITLTVSDDGVGFEAAARQPKGMGLRIMSHRASMIGGTVILQKQRSGGTKMVCTTAA